MTCFSSERESQGHSREPRGPRPWGSSPASALHEQLDFALASLSLSLPNCKMGAIRVLPRSVVQEHEPADRALGLLPRQLSLPPASAACLHLLTRRPRRSAPNFLQQAPRPLSDLVTPLPHPQPPQEPRVRCGFAPSLGSISAERMFRGRQCG